MSNWKIGVIIFIIIVAGGVLFVFRHSISGFVHGTPSTPPVTTSPPPVEPTLLTYASSTLGISIQYPPSYSVNDAYAYSQFGPKKLIHGISLTIPASMATGTNLSNDTYVSVEQLPRAKVCSADIFIPANVKAVTIVDSGTTYSVASSTGAGAGNRYEETVYAVPGSNPCTAVRYYVHYGVIENYPAGTVQEFDRAALIGAFDQIRHSLVVGQ